MNKTIYLDENYSTTRLLTKEKPQLEQKPEYKLEPKLFLSPNNERKGEGGLRTKGLFKKSYKNKPLISIVTVVYNGEKHLEQTIKSVLDQGYDNVEYIVIDGGSTDGTLEIIKKYEEQIDYWVSESDGGIYYAMNKGVSLCAGDYIAFLNADDWHNDDTIETVVNFINNGDVDYVYGKVDIYEKNEYIFTQNVNMPGYKAYMPFGHPSLFVRRKYLLEMPFDRQYSVIADYNFVVGLIEKGLSNVNSNKSLANFRIGGVSSDGKHYYQHFKIMKNNYGFLRAVHYHILRRNNKYIVAVLNGMSKIVSLGSGK